ncbi:MAG: hypothetical protein NVSMB17_06560 [Candidatus Dormibacteria bacterium]
MADLTTVAEAAGAASGDPADLTPEDLDEIGARTGSLMTQLLDYPHPQVQELTEAMLQGLDMMHRSALIRMANLLDHQGVLEQAVADPVVRHVLDLYQIIEVSEEEKVDTALADIRPYIESHGGQLQVLSVREGVVTVALAGSCRSCAASTFTLKRGVEGALLEHYEGFKRMVVEEAAAPPEQVRPTFISLEDVQEMAPRTRPVFQDALPEEQVQGMVTVTVGGQEVLLHRVNGDIYAFRKGGDRVESYPVAIERGTVRVAVNVPAAAPIPGAAR